VSWGEADRKVGRATFPARTRQLTSQALTEGKTVPAVHPRARVRLRAVAVALCVSSSLVVGIASGPAQAAGPTSTGVSSTVLSSTASSSTAVVPAQADELTSSALSSTAYVASATKAAVKAKTVKHKAVKKVVKHKVVKKVVKKKAAPKLAFGVRVVRDASVYRGTPYQYGAAGPSRFDCSGFTRFIFAKFGISLPHSSSGQYSMVRHVANSQKQIGDLVFFHTGGGHVYHVGIYAGGDEIWAATHTGDFVRLEGMWNASYYVGRVS
jgi:cell wall-associated NlpC family hydrolase